MQKINHFVRLDIELPWDSRRCIHTPECVHSLPEEFGRDQRWIEIEAMPAEILATPAPNQ